MFHAYNEIDPIWKYDIYSNDMTVNQTEKQLPRRHVAAATFDLLFFKLISILFRQVFDVNLIYRNILS